MGNGSRHVPLAAVARCIHATVGRDGPSSVRLVMPDDRGRLKVVHAEGVGEQRHNRRLAVGRRQVFRSRRYLRLPDNDVTGCAIVIFPLGVEERPLGVVEVTAPFERLRERDEALRSVVDQSATVLAAAMDREESERALRAMRSLLLLVGDLMRVRSADEALRLTATHMFEFLARPVAAVTYDPESGRWCPAAVWGLASMRRERLIGAIEAVDAASPGPGAVEALRSAFASATRRTGADAAAAGRVVLLAAPSREAEAYLPVAASLLEQAVAHREEVLRARSRAERLDAGIAWTVHELRSPLVGVHAAIEHIIGLGGPSQGLELLERSREEIERLVALVDPLLRWATGSDGFAFERVDLADIVRGAVESVELNGDRPRLTVDIAGRHWVDADPSSLRVALANLVRNAVKYSPSDRPIRVYVRTDRGTTLVSVRDWGPGVDAEELDAIFEPYARGSAGRPGDGGKGLGLFIARRIVEAHGGEIEVTRADPGAVFTLRLPSARGGEQLSAS